MKKIMLPVDSVFIKARMKELGYTYKIIQEISDGKISEMSLKHFLNNGKQDPHKAKRVDEETLNILANLLSCPASHLIEKDYFLSTNLSDEINLAVENLYLRNKEDVNSVYNEEIKKFKTNMDLKLMLDQTHFLFQQLATDDYVFDKTPFVKSFNSIRERLILDKCIANRELTEIQDNLADNLYSKIISASGTYNTQQIILMFLYVLILFDAIFTREAIATASQLTPERKTSKADQFYVLTYRSEKLRNLLIDWVLYKGFIFDDPQIIELGIDDIAIEGIVLMLAACEKCYRHINGIFCDSEYINRAVLSAILTKLEKIIIELGIPIPEDFVATEYIKMNTSRFGIHYNALKAFFRKLNPPKKRQNKELGAFACGFLFASNNKCC